MKRYWLSAFVALTAVVFGGITFSSEDPAVAVEVVDPDLKNMQWNRYTTENFTILSIDDIQGKWLAANIEGIKSWCITRWGFPDFKFTKECRVMCIPNRDVMKKLFNLTESRCEIRRKDGQIEMTVLWLILDDKPSRSIPVQLTAVCMAEFESRHNVRMPWFAQRGTALLNSTLPEVRAHLAGLASDLTKGTPVFPCEVMFTMTQDDYVKQTADSRRVFDHQSVALCLMLRKEFGEAKMQGFYRLSNKNKPEDVLKLVYRFNGFQHFDSSYGRYMRDLSKDIISNRTPDSYLEIKPVK